MVKNSMGQFIAALRKAKGMTQQDLADRLNVSNKAVSRWERDECAPDISLIPAIAEIFGVTCDELLKGERILESSSSEKKQPRVEKQIQNIIKKTLSDFKAQIWISLANSVVGLVCMFGISYGFYRPVIGFSVMLLFEVCAVVLSVLAVTKAKEVKNDNELFEMADISLINKYNNTLGTLSFVSFFVIFAVVLFSLPLILCTSDYVDSVITLYSYFKVFFGGIVLILVLAYLLCKKTFAAWITNSKLPQKSSSPTEKTRKRLTLIQVSLTIIAAALFIIAPFFNHNPNEKPVIVIVIALVALACLLGNMITFVVFCIKEKEERQKLVLTGIRNTLLIPSALIVSKMHGTVWYINGSTDNNMPVDDFVKHDLWFTEYLWYALLLVAVVLIGFVLFEKLIIKKK